MVLATSLFLDYEYTGFTEQKFCKHYEPLIESSEKFRNPFEGIETNWIINAPGQAQRDISQKAHEAFSLGKQ